MKSLGKAIIAAKNGEEKATLVYKRKADRYEGDSEIVNKSEVKELSDNHKEN